MRTSSRVGLTSQHNSFKLEVRRAPLAELSPGNSINPRPLRGSAQSGFTNAVLISFEGPVFFAPADEDQFFGWLSSLPEYQTIRGTGTTLELSLSCPVQPETVQQLLVVFRRWPLDVTPLLPLRSPETSNFVLWDSALADVPRIEIQLRIHAKATFAGLISGLDH